MLGAASSCSGVAAAGGSGNSSLASAVPAASGTAFAAWPAETFTSLVRARGYSADAFQPSGGSHDVVLLAKFTQYERPDRASFFSMKSDRALARDAGCGCSGAQGDHTDGRRVLVALCDETTDARGERALSSRSSAEDKPSFGCRSSSARAFDACDTDGCAVSADASCLCLCLCFFK